MNTSLSKRPAIQVIDPSESEIHVRRGPAGLSDSTLQVLQVAAETHGGPSDAFRNWLQDEVLREIGRRAANDGSDDQLVEASLWRVPWHKWNDEQLAGALAATYTWLGLDVTTEAAEVFDSLHCAVLTACCTRLGELHEAIERSRANP